jgi:hypothetical protein
MGSASICDTSRLVDYKKRILHAQRCETFCKHDSYPKISLNAGHLTSCYPMEYVTDAFFVMNISLREFIVM